MIAKTQNVIFGSKWLFLLIAVLALFSLAGCKKEEGDIPLNQPEKNAPPTLQNDPIKPKGAEITPELPKSEVTPELPKSEVTPDGQKPEVTPSEQKPEVNSGSEPIPKETTTESNPSS